MPPASIQAKAERAKKAVEATKVHATKVMTHATKVEKANESRQGETEENRSAAGWRSAYDFRRTVAATPGQGGCRTGHAAKLIAQRRFVRCVRQGVNVMEVRDDVLDSDVMGAAASFFGAVDLWLRTLRSREALWRQPRLCRLSPRPLASGGDDASTCPSLVRVGGLSGTPPGQGPPYETATLWDRHLAAN
jgi:hypothetical protein